ncbi:MAG: hypothetical protein ACI8TS_001618, partial [Flavobacteriales bacterium]
NLRKDLMKHFTAVHLPGNTTNVLSSWRVINAAGDECYFH